MIYLTVRKDRIGPLLGRHPWVFSGALKDMQDGIEAGTSVKLMAEGGGFLAQGYFNSYSQIAVRVWGHDETEEVDEAFFRRRVEAAYEIRRRYIGAGTDSFRVINAENDFLPGLIVDKYADWLVVQCHTAGIGQWREMIVKALIDVIKPRGIFERTDMKVRGIEGAERTNTLLYGDVPDIVTIAENGFRFLVDIKGGQKTGFFLDQRAKRDALRKYVRDKSVLNCFSYSGGFSVYAMAGGARHTVSVDLSEPALALARENMKLNGFSPDKCEFVNADVKYYLRALTPQAHEVIVLDPPAFIKDRKKKDEGIVGYKGINENALRALPPGGILLTCSCSAHLSLLDFRYILSECSGRTHRTVQILETYTHDIDHPELIAFTEGEYLKCFIASVS